MPTAMYSIDATVGLHVTVPCMPVLQLYASLRGYIYASLKPYISFYSIYMSGIYPIEFLFEGLML